MTTHRPACSISSIPSGTRSGSAHPVNRPDLVHSLSPHLSSISDPGLVVTLRTLLPPSLPSPIVPPPMIIAAVDDATLPTRFADVDATERRNRGSGPRRTTARASSSIIAYRRDSSITASFSSSRRLRLGERLFEY